jgi:hypothetical protein
VPKVKNIPGAIPCQMGISNGLGILSTLSNNQKFQITAIKKKKVVIEYIINSILFLCLEKNLISVRQTIVIKKYGPKAKKIVPISENIPSSVFIFKNISKALKNTAA